MSMVCNATEYSTADLPLLGNDFTCENCRSTRPVSEFVRTETGLDIPESFHG